MPSKYGVIAYKYLISATVLVVRFDPAEAIRFIKNKNPIALTANQKMVYH